MHHTPGRSRESTLNREPMVIVEKKRGPFPQRERALKKAKLSAQPYCPGQTLASSFWNESQLCTEVDLGAPK
jgi:hypothetical protein